ncbi:MAG: hypothetical protein H6Q76_2024, partial [Firmicutes bacterium]|nr:hypothetical protein [Bacillota bacterium]
VYKDINGGVRNSHDWIYPKVVL